MGQTETSKTKARGLERAFDILDYLCHTGKPLRPIDIATGMSAPKSSIYELVGILVSANVLERTGVDGKVFLGRKLNYWSANYLKHFDLNKIAQPILQWITEQTRETAQLCMLDGKKYYVAMMNEGSRPFRISAEVGARTPIPWTASGRLLLGHLSEDEIVDFIPEADFTMPSGETLEPTKFARSAHQAWADQFFSFESVADTFTHCFAAPVLGPTNICECTLCIIAPKDDAVANYEQYRRTLITAAKELSAKLRHEDQEQSASAAE